MKPGWTGHWALPRSPSSTSLEDVRRTLVGLSCGGLGPAQLARLLDAGLAEAQLRRNPGPGLTLLRRSGARALTCYDDEYPESLCHISAPPPLLYVRGLPLREPFVAIVGSRVCTSGARRFARRLAGVLAESGFCVVSGLARGIDVAAHEGALESGRTVAVLGTGIDQVYPTEHRRVAERISNSGALISEFPPGTGPRAWHFPARNRIVSGMSIAVIVVEASISSGALITASFAAEQGREIFACTTGPENPAGAGVRELLRDGARLVVDPYDTAQELIELARDQGLTLPPRRSPAPKPNGPGSAVYDAISESTTVDEIVSLTGLPPGTVAGVLTELELDGFVTAEDGRRYSRLK